MVAGIIFGVLAILVVIAYSSEETPRKVASSMSMRLDDVISGIAFGMVSGFITGDSKAMVLSRIRHLGMKIHQEYIAKQDGKTYIECLVGGEIMKYSFVINKHELLEGFVLEYSDCAYSGLDVYRKFKNVLGEPDDVMETNYVWKIGNTQFVILSKNAPSIVIRDFLY